MSDEPATKPETWYQFDPYGVLPDGKSRGTIDTIEVIRSSEHYAWVRFAPTIPNQPETIRKVERAINRIFPTWEEAAAYMRSEADDELRGAESHLQKAMSRKVAYEAYLTAERAKRATKE